VHWQVEDLPVIVADKIMLQQLMENLISNALKFTRPRAEAEISIRARKEAGGAITITVQDNGVGFDMQYYEKLFQVFQRLHREEEFEGVGVGLANVRRIVERHGGRVWGKELRFTFHFRKTKRSPRRHGGTEKKSSSEYLVISS
jgi:light-regulated signal transduction histidine kinase (bacteriophytochrome)